MSKKMSFLFGFLILFVLIQFIPVTRSNPSTETEVPAPREIKEIFRRVCFNCHSNETVWPWYSHVAPVSWLVASDVSEARGKMNFTAWNRMDRKKSVTRVRDIWKAVEKGEMPPWYYRWVHPEAHLAEKEKQLIQGWSLGTSGSLGFK